VAPTRASSLSPFAHRRQYNRTLFYPTANKELGIWSGSCDATWSYGGRQRSPFLAVDFFGRSTTALGRTA
jgi:hypothetical protein